jgi:hypothetical protein
MSARSSIYDYVEENGRTYHRYKEGVRKTHLCFRHVVNAFYRIYVIYNGNVSISHPYISREQRRLAQARLRCA